MPSTFTDDLRIELMADGENNTTWGSKSNVNVFELFEDALTAETAVSTTGGTTVLTANNGTTDQARAVFLDISGTLVSNATIEIPAANKFYLVRNATTGAFTVTIKTNAGAGQLVTQGATVLVYCDNNLTFRIGLEDVGVLADLAALSVVADNEFIVGTGAGTYAHENPATARASMGVVIGTDVQAEDAVLTDLAALSAVADNEFIVGTGAGTYAHENPATARTSMGAQTQDAVLDDLAALAVVADNEFIVGTGAGTYAHENPATARASMSAQEDVITTQGDLVRGSATNVAERLAVGTTAQFLGNDGTDVAWEALPTAAVQFLVNPTSAQNNIATGSQVTVVWGTEVYDTGGDFASNAFTAPTTGKYRFDVWVDLVQVDTAASLYEIRLITSNRAYVQVYDPTSFSADLRWTFPLSILADMDAADTATVTIEQTGGTAQTDIQTQSRFSGNFQG